MKKGLLPEIESIILDRERDCEKIELMVLSEFGVDGDLWKGTRTLAGVLAAKRRRLGWGGQRRGRLLVTESVSLRP